MLERKHVRNILLILLAVSLCIIGAYKSGLKLMNPIYVYHSWVVVAYWLSWGFVCLSPIFLVNIYYKHLVLRVASVMLSIVIVGFTMLSMSAKYAPEHHDNGYIAQVKIGLHHTRVYFFEDINLFIMKESDRPYETYGGCYDRYKEE